MLPVKLSRVVKLSTVHDLKTCAAGCSINPQFQDESRLDLVLLCTRFRCETIQQFVAKFPSMQAAFHRFFVRAALSSTPDLAVSSGQDHP